MTNAPEKCETWRFADTDKATIYFYEIPDSKKPRTSTFRLMKEDHTLGNLIRARLLENRKVRFAGYRIPHPLEMELHIRVETTEEITPMQAFISALTTIEQCTDDFEKAFEKSLRQFNSGRRY
jgi:DNA-directed RNA polymerase II subunit RPB11